MNRIKLSYNSSLSRVRCELTPALVREAGQQPDRWIQRAWDKLNGEKQNGKVEAFEVYDDQFNSLWESMKQASAEDDNTVVRFTLGQGGHRLGFCQLAVDSDGSGLLLTLSPQPDELKNLTWNNFLFGIQLAASEVKAGFIPHEAMLRSAYLNIRKGLPVTHWRLRPQPTAADCQSKDIKITMSHERRESYLYLLDASVLVDAESLRALNRRVEHAFEQLAKKFDDAVLLKQELGRHLEEMKSGSERFGVGLPRVILLSVSRNVLGGRANGSANRSAAQNSKPDAKPSSAKGASSAKKEPASAESGDWLVRFEIDDDGLEARIRDVNKAVVYSNQSKGIDKKTLLAELKKAGIVYGMGPFLEQILNALALGSGVEGQVIARGQAPTEGYDPYLHPVYLDNNEDLSKEQQVDMRSAQNRSIVKEGDVIAEYRFRDGKSGTNVFGQEIYAPVTEPGFPVQPGDGVIHQGDGRFVATVDGMPVITNKRIYCSPIYIHEGDINMSSGNLHFEGSAEIRGNIESGATVIISENLIVRGMIGQAYVRCGGDMKVEGGIVSSSRGWVEAGCNMAAEFIDNSQVAVGGNLDIRHSIVTSHVVVGGNLKIRDRVEGLVGGGWVSVHGQIQAGRLGFEDGRKTVIHAGADWVVERRIAIQQSRRQKIQQTLEQEKKNVDELQKNGRRSKEQEKLLAEKNKYVHRLGVLVRKIDRKLEKVERSVNWNREALVRVHGRVVNNCEIIVGGKLIPIPEQMRAVMFTYHKYRDSRINPLEFYEAYRKARARAKLMDSAGGQKVS